MKPRHMLMSAAVVIAGWLALFGDKTASGTIAEPVKRTVLTRNTVGAAMATAQAVSAQRTDGSMSNAGAERPATILALQNRDSFIWDGLKGRQAGALFNSQSWTPPPPPPPKIQLPPLPPPPPMAPPLPFTYLGKKIEDGVWEVYLARGEKTIIVRPQSVIEGTYQVDAITPPTLSLTYIPLKQVQRLTIGGTD